MRKFQRVAVVAAAIAGLSALGAGVSSAAGNEDAPPQITAVANSSANAVAVGGGYYTQPQGQPQGQQQDEGHPGPEQGYGQHQGDE
ncbi:hypothetical protein [Streptomyces sp. MMG1121]|uniref:hypothetical protein n=1 Tax=Streptomyces sp. MMG1121 TaxID=1415544 RepID=UPI0006AE37F2|nr:hypothetical protein [Streptomyces sp. MMG1121]KOV64993.1 hypothetical protein ADK64_15885 [Streptomyces sp. MMG1121]